MRGKRRKLWGEGGWGGGYEGRRDGEGKRRSDNKRRITRDISSGQNGLKE